MLSAIRRTWPFDSSCCRTRVMSLEVSTLFYLAHLTYYPLLGFTVGTKGYTLKNYEIFLRVQLF